MDHFVTWPLSKQYLSAHFYLSEEKPISITEAQRAQLGALHLYVSYGKYHPGLDTPDLQLCSPAERKKRVEEWKKLSSFTKATAMKKFLDLLTCLFPNWSRSRKLLYEFQLEWSSLEQVKTIKKLNFQSKVSKRPLESSQYRRSSVSPLTNVHREMQEKQFSPTKPLKKQAAKTNFYRAQSIDIPNTLYSFKEIEAEIAPPRFPIVADSVERYKAGMKDMSHLKHFIEDLQSYKGGNIHNTSASKFPKLSNKPDMKDEPELDPPINFDKELKNYRRSLLQQEFNKHKYPAAAHSLHLEFDKIQTSISSLKLVLQQLNN